MVQVITLIFTIFIGWLIFDYAKHKKLTKENILSAFLSALVAGAVYYLLFWLI